MSVEGLLFLGQLSLLRFLNRSPDRQARHLLFCPSLGGGHRYLAALLGETLITLVGIRLIPGRYAPNSVEVITQCFVMRLAWRGLADRENMKRAVRHELGLECEACLYPKRTPCAWRSQSDASRAALWRQSACGDLPPALILGTAQD